MKKIEAIIRPEKLDAVCSALEVLGYHSLTITQVDGHGKQKGISLQWRGEEYRIKYLPKIKLEIVVKEHRIEDIINTILDNARTNEIGDGKIFVSNVEDVIRIRTGEHGKIAI